MTTEQTTAAANTALVRSTLDTFNAGDFDTCVARLSPDFVMNLAGPLTAGARRRPGS